MSPSGNGLPLAMDKDDDEELVAYPGLRLCCVDEGFISGDGTYENQGYIYACLVGIVEIIDINNERKRVEVVACGGGASIARAGTLVTAVVARVTGRAVRCEVRCAGPRPLTRPLRAVLRREAVRLKDVDRIDMHKCYRPGDIILARVLPMTELQFCQLSTAEPQLGVVTARAAGAPPGSSMVPISWSEMQCPVTFVKEHRKVAKVAPENVRELLQKAQLTAAEQ